MARAEVPDDFVFWFGDTPVLMSELEAWYPGISGMPMVEALEYIPIFLGMSDTQVSLADMKIDYKMVKVPEPEDPAHDLWLTKKELEQELIDKMAEIQKEITPHTLDPDKVDRLHKELSYIREELEDKSRKFSMISKLSENPDKKSK